MQRVTCTSREQTSKYKQTDKLWPVMKKWTDLLMMNTDAAQNLASLGCHSFTRLT